MNKDKFRLPRKIKKKLKNKFYFYPPKKDGSRLMAFPTENQKDYDALKKGIVTTPFDYTKAELEARKEAWRLKFKTPVEIPDEELLNAINQIFAEQYRKNAYRVFLKAKTHPIAIGDYHIFVNAWLRTKDGDDCSTTACMSLDSAEDNIKRTKPRNNN